MITKHQINFINSVLIPYLPEKIGLFGSRIRGEESENSDLDILLSFKGEGESPYSLFELLSIEKRLQEKLGFLVEIVNDNNIKNYVLRERIYKDLLIIYQDINYEDK